MSFNQGLAAGTAAGLAAQRLNSKPINQNNDQVLIKSEHTVKSCVEKISELRTQWVGKESEIIQKKSVETSFTGVTFIMTTVAVVIGFLLFIMTPGAHDIYPLSLVETTIICLFFGLLSGRIATTGYAKLGYIDIKKSNRETLILVELYDSNGNRNLDEDEVYNIINAVEGIRLN